MKEFKNKLTGALMLVDDSREQEYIEMGYTPISIFEDEGEDPTRKPIKKIKKKGK
jgi:hypothetical protein|nr:MAG TPA: hypothetical protein [Caudoviricetes sp.]